MKTLPPETELLRSFERLFATRRRDVRVGVGDDAAVLAAPSALAVCTDALVEGEDFTVAADPYLVGRKAMNVNLSDLAAMGATPLHALLTLGLPRETPVAWLDGFLDGFRAAAREQAVAVVGGDLSAARERFASVTVLGRVADEGPLRRGGGGPGDELWVSGTLGAAAAGLAFVLRGYRRDRDGKVTAPRGSRVSPARRDVAMTGEITLRGEVLPIGGEKEKTLAARRAGVRTILLPAQNERDLAEIPEELRRDLAFVFVERAEQVLENALVRPAARRPGARKAERRKTTRRRT